MNRLFCLIASFALATAAHADYIDLSESGEMPPDPAYVVSPDAADRLPRWSPNDGTAPPLELDRALKIARTCVQTRFPDQELRLGSADLRLPGTAYAKRIPYYSITILYRPKGSTGDEAIHWSRASAWWFVMLMDGTVLTRDPKRD